MSFSQPEESLSAPTRAASAPPSAQRFSRHILDFINALEKAIGSWSSRVVWFFLFASSASVIAVAALLTPDPAGHGTHTQLGLPPCGFLVMTGYPCPGCGLTTSFAHMVRLEFVGATAANPFGVALFLATAVSAVISAIGFVRRWPVMETLETYRVDLVCMVLAASSLLTWGARIVGMLLASL